MYTQHCIKWSRHFTRGFYAKPHGVKFCRYVHNDSHGIKFSLYAQRHEWRKIFPLCTKAILRQSMYDCLRNSVKLALDYSSHTNQRHRLWFIFRSHAAVQQLWVYRNWSMMTQHLWKLDHGSAHSGVLERARISNSGSYSLSQLDYALSWFMGNNHERLFI